MADIIYGNAFWKVVLSEPFEDGEPGEIDGEPGEIDGVLGGIDGVLGGIDGVLGGVDGLGFLERPNCPTDL